MNKNSSIAVMGGGIVVVIVIAAAAFMLFGTSNDQEIVKSLVDDTNENKTILDNDKPRVLASFYPYYEFTRNVAGDSAIVEQYLPLNKVHHPLQLVT